MKNNETITLAFKRAKLMTEFGEISINENGDLVYSWPDYTGDEPVLLVEILEASQHLKLPLTVTMYIREVNGIDIEWYNIKDGVSRTIFRGPLV